MLESERFGHVRGAFTGAQTDRPGLFESAEGSTLLSDEIGDMRTALQAKLTRVLETRAVRRVGDARERGVDVRIAAATHQNLRAMVQDGRFREDLWFRLDVCCLELPPLRERREDIPLLAAHFLAERGPLVGSHATGFSQESVTHRPGRLDCDPPRHSRKRASRLSAVTPRDALSSPEWQTGARSAPRRRR